MNKNTLEETLYLNKKHWTTHLKIHTHASKNTHTRTPKNTHTHTHTHSQLLREWWRITSSPPFRQLCLALLMPRLLPGTLLLEGVSGVVEEVPGVEEHEGEVGGGWWQWTQRSPERKRIRRKQKLYARTGWYGHMLCTIYNSYVHNIVLPKNTLINHVILLI